MNPVLPLELIGDPCPFRVVAGAPGEFEFRAEALDRPLTASVYRGRFPARFVAEYYDADQFDWGFKCFQDLADAVALAIRFVMPQPPSVAAAVALRDARFGEIGQAD